MNACAHCSRDPRALIGTPYVRFGSDPRVGFDCFGLVRYVRREYFGLDTPIAGTARAPEIAILASRLLLCWRETVAPGAPGDVAAMAAAHGRALHHVGVVLDDGVLHAWCGLSARGGGVVFTPWRQLHASFPCVEVWTTWPS